MNQRADRRRPFHRVRQPHVQRQLRRFSTRAHEKQQASDRECPKMSHRIRRPRIRLGEKLHEIQRSKCLEQQKHPQHESKVPDAIDDERLLPRIRSRLLEKIETDQQVTRKPHALPAHKQQHIVRRQHQDQHEKHEQVEVRKESVVPALMRHVSGRVNVNEPAHSGYHEHHHNRELVHLQIEAGAENARRDPGKEFLVEKNLPRLEKLADRFKRSEKRQARRSQRHAVNNLVRPLRAKNSIHRRARTGSRSVSRNNSSEPSQLFSRWASTVAPSTATRIRNDVSSNGYTKSLKIMFEIPSVEAISPVCGMACTLSVDFAIVAATNPASATTSSNPGAPAIFEMLVCSSTPAFKSMITNTNSTIIAPP